MHHIHPGSTMPHGARWAAELANRWLRSHDQPPVSAAWIRANVRPAAYHQLPSRSPVTTPGAWFGSASVRRALCERYAGLYRLRDVIAARMRRRVPERLARSQVRDPLLSPYTPSRSRRRVVIAIRTITQSLDAMGGWNACHVGVWVYGCWCVCPMHPVGPPWHVNVHEGAGNVPMDLYEREMASVLAACQQFRDCWILGDTHSFTIRRKD